MGRIPVNIAVSGRHMVTNALLAAAVGRSTGLSLEEIAKGLEEAVLTSGRLRAFEENGIYVLDDTYNANPESMRAGIETLSEREIGEGGRYFAVLGQMAELGAIAAQEHQKIGGFAAKRDVVVVSVGKEAKGISEGADSNNHFDKREDAADWLKSELKSGDAVLFKGSRAAAVEQVMKQIFPQN